MALVINCECGLTCRGESEAEVLAAAERHVAEDHPELVGRVSREDLRGMMERVDG